MKKEYAITIPLVLIFFIMAQGLYAKKPTYWDYFREPEKKTTTSWYDIDVNLYAAGPLNDEMGQHTHLGLGFLLGFHYQKNFFRAGFELGGAFFPGMDEGVGENDMKTTDFFINLPLYCDIGFDIKLHRVFSLVPFISTGISLDMLRYIPGGLSILGGSDDAYEDAWSLHLAERAGLGFWFHVNKFYTIQINVAYTPLIEIGDEVSVAHIVQLSLGFLARL